ncbi:hypothetical protein QC820_16290 [Halomonas mongoliensis]|uniref:Uncharacterized protein n=1 Tax=Halomonas mongoliensis TaxID=321265 RepID=A0ABU1GQR0_9GAMM|nr:hypothetical protein [Halomonas mongoliensis]MDR5894349.1 hypothetical protein [Halomonas mongoliensis]
MPTPIQRTAPTHATFTTFTRMPGREPGEQQHGYPFKPERLPEAPLQPPGQEELDAPARRGTESDADLMSQDINATDDNGLL